MTDNTNQIARKDAKNCFVESLSDAFAIGKIHLGFATYDVSKPSGERQTNYVSIYIDVDDFLELCRRIGCGELQYTIQQRKQTNNSAPVYESIGGTSAEKLEKIGKAREDGKSLSRIVKIVAGKKSDVLFIADSGPGETDEHGLIVPKFGNSPENHVAVSMTMKALSELLLLTKAHFDAWLSAMYVRELQRDVL